MKIKRLANSLKTRRTYVCIIAFLPFFVVMCHNKEKQNQIKKLDNQISTLDNKISGTNDLRNAKVPANLAKTQARYNMAADSLDKQSDTLQLCVWNNENLIMHAFNNYATRIGRDFQASAFLSQSDIMAFQQRIAKLDSMDFIHEQARNRILQNKGSLHDLFYFFEFLDFDSINSELNNKLAWNFYPVALSEQDTMFTEESILNFENDTLNKLLLNEINLLNMAWTPDTTSNNLKKDSVNASGNINVLDSAVRDTTNEKRNFDTTSTIDLSQSGMPNFSIPEFDSVRIQYMRNDSVINKYNNMFMDMMKAEDSLEQYRQQIIRTRDSLVEKRNELEK